MQFETLERWGIRNLRALAALPQIALSERMGQAGVRLQKLACGNLSRTLVPVDVPLTFEEAAELEYPIVLLEPLAFFLNRMLEQFCARLGARALSTQELTLRLTLATEWHNDENADLPSFRSQVPSSTFERTLRLPVPLLDRQDFSQAVAIGFEGESARRSYSQNSFVGAARAAARGAGRAFSPSIAGTGKARTHAGAHRRHCRRG